MGPRTLCSLFLCHLIWLSCGSPVEVAGGNGPTEEPEDLSFLHAEYNRLKDKLCSKKWKIHGFHCYRYFDTPRTFDEAEEECQSHGYHAHLSSVISAWDSVFLANLVQNAEHDVWIGLRNVEECETWSWIDNTPYNKDYTPWAVGQPDLCSHSQVCGQLTHDSKYYKWNDVECHSRSGYICEALAGVRP